MNKIFILLLALVSGQVFADSFNVYVSADGNDLNDGFSAGAAVETLWRVQNVLVDFNPNQPVVVHIAPGTYYEQSTIWTYTNGHSITFTALNFSKERPVFDGRGLGEWFRLVKRDGKNSFLKFRYIKVQNYNTAMSFYGDRDEYDSWNGGNELYGMYFYRIGAKYSREDESYSAVRFVNSRDNSVINSHFVDVLNPRSSASLIHSIYLAHYSSQNQILRNRFLRTNGDPVRTRDESNSNYISDNRFYSAGDKAFYSDWFCDKEEGCTKNTGECPSVGNEFRSNFLESGYGGFTKVFALYGDTGFCGENTIPRLRTSGNVRN